MAKSEDGIDRSKKGLEASLKSDAFNLARERMRQKAELLKKAGVPHDGIWYWLYLAPTWKLFKWEGKDSLHVQVWPSLANAYLVPHYKLAAPEARQVAELAYAFPRGRVSSETEGTLSYFFIRHGNDTPTPDGLRQIESDFNLTRHLLEDMAEEIYDPHETMVQAEKTEMEKLIGVEY